MGSCAKLALGYSGSFQTLERVELAAYIFSLPPTLKSHNVFHISLVKKYAHDVNHVFDWYVL